MRDLLPGEAASRRRLARAVLEHFALHGYDVVTPPAFELAFVLERGLGTLDPRDVLRFVEPESGEVAALRPDMTPQIARMTATRLAERPVPMRLSYEGTVLRRRQERARRHRQIPQAGVELIGVPGPDGDLELLALAASAARAAGLTSFVLDVGHAGIARALLVGATDAAAASVLEALAHKDAKVVADRARSAGVAAKSVDALAALAALHGDAAVWGEARALLGDGPAAAPLAALQALWDRAAAAGLAGVLRVDLGEVRGFAYYTGPIFHLYAEGPGEAVASGGRYDDLLARFGLPLPAAGFAVDLDNLAWALRDAGVATAAAVRVLVRPGAGAEALLGSLRAQGVAAALGPAADALAYARAWEFPLVAGADGDAIVVVDVATGREARVPAGGAAEAITSLASRPGSG